MSVMDTIGRSSGIAIPSSFTSYTTFLRPGAVHCIRMWALSQHYPSETEGLIFHRGTYYTVRSPTITSSSITATSVTITWSQLVGSLAADDYTISLERLNGSNRQLCPTITDSRQMTTNTTSMSFTNLQEFSIYIVTVTGRLYCMSRTSTLHEFTTASTGKCRSDPYSISLGSL